MALFQKTSSKSFQTTSYNHLSAFLKKEAYMYVSFYHSNPLITSKRKNKDRAGDILTKLQKSDSSHKKDSPNFFKSRQGSLA